MFRTQYTPRKEVFSRETNSVYVEFSPVYDKDGHYELKESGRHDLYREIQCYRDDADLHQLVDRYLAGDSSVISRRSGSYGDYTDMPETYAELLNTYNRMRNEFYDLPLDVREKFGQDFNSYLASAGSDSWLEKLGFKVMQENLDVQKDMSNKLDSIDHGGELIEE